MDEVGRTSRLAPSQHGGLITQPAPAHPFCCPPVQVPQRDAPAAAQAQQQATGRRAWCGAALRVSVQAQLLQVLKAEGTVARGNGAGTPGLEVTGTVPSRRPVVVAHIRFTQCTAPKEAPRASSQAAAATLIGLP